MRTLPLNRILAAAALEYIVSHRLCSVPLQFAGALLGLWVCLSLCSLKGYKITRVWYGNRKQTSRLAKNHVRQDEEYDDPKKMEVTM